MFAIGFLLVALAALIFKTDTRHPLVQLVAGHRKIDYAAAVAFFVGLGLMLASTGITAWRYLP